MRRPEHQHPRAKCNKAADSTMMAISCGSASPARPAVLTSATSVANVHAQKMEPHCVKLTKNCRGASINRGVYWRGFNVRTL